MCGRTTYKISVRVSSPSTSRVKVEDTGTLGYVEWTGETEERVDVFPNYLHNSSTTIWENFTISFLSTRGTCSMSEVFTIGNKDEIVNSMNFYVRKVWIHHLRQLRPAPPPYKSHPRKLLETTKKWV